MKVNADNIEVTNNEGEGRFEARVDGHLAVSEYRREGNTIVFTHTEVPKALSGQGVGNRLVGEALDYSRAAGLVVVPVCPFVRAYIQRHKEYQDLLDPEQRAELMSR